jgi:hypothetical protein
LAEIRDRLEQTQQHYKLHYDRKHRNVEFQVGDWVWLRLLHRPITSLSVQGRGKLGPRFFGPFQVLAHVGGVAHQLQLPMGATLHDVFHVGLLKKYHSDRPEGPGTLPPTHHGRACVQPEEVTKSRLMRGRLEFLVHWSGQPAASASWVEADEFRSVYPTFKLADELNLQAGRDVMTGIQYVRQRKKQGRINKDPNLLETE